MRSAASVNTRSTFCACPRARYTMCDASFTMLAIFGCVSSRRICTRVRIGPIRDCISVTSRFTFSVVRRIWNSNTVKITTCTTSASAATMLKTSSHTCIHAPHAPRGRNRVLSHYPALHERVLGRLRGLPIRFLRAFDGRSNRVFLPDSHFFSTLDQFIGAFAQLTRFTLRVFFSFVGPLRKEFTRLFTGLWRKKHAHQGANTKTDQKVRHFGTYVVRHATSRDSKDNVAQQRCARNGG